MLLEASVLSRVDSVVFLRRNGCVSGCGGCVHENDCENDHGDENAHDCVHDCDRACVSDYVCESGYDCVHETDGDRHGLIWSSHSRQQCVC